jgi:hypothetical protein
MNSSIEYNPDKSEGAIVSLFYISVPYLIKYDYLGKQG